MTRTRLLAIAMTLATSTAAVAQTVPMAPPTTSTTMPSAISTNTGDSNTTAAPVAGANSFTKSQATELLTTRGFTAVTGLAKDDKSVWRGTAVRDGKLLAVAVDYPGNVVAR